MPDESYMDAAAVPVPDAGNDTLRDEMARTITASLHGGRWIDMTPRKIAHALLPLIREHVAAERKQARAAVLREIADSCLSSSMAKWLRRLANGQETADDR